MEKWTKEKSVFCEAMVPSEKALTIMLASATLKGVLTSRENSVLIFQQVLNSDVKSHSQIMFLTTYQMACPVWEFKTSPQLLWLCYAWSNVPKVEQTLFAGKEDGFHYFLFIFPTLTLEDERVMKIKQRRGRIGNQQRSTCSLKKKKKVLEMEKNKKNC